MAETIFPLDNSRPFTDQEHIGHNRWHPEIPPVATVRPGQTFRVECRDWFDGYVRNDGSAGAMLTTLLPHRAPTLGALHYGDVRPLA